MRILFITNFYPPHDLGGWEQNCQEVVSRMEARGHACHVLTSRFSVRGNDRPEQGVSRQLYLEADVHHYRPVDFFVQRPRQERENRRALRDVLDTFRPNGVFIWGMWNLSPQVAYWAEHWMLGRVAYAVASYWPMELRAHEAYWQQPARARWVRALMMPARHIALGVLTRERRTYRLDMEHVACVSNHVRRRLSEAGALPHGARVIYNGVDPGPFAPTPAEPAPGPAGMRLIYVGGIIPSKGVHTAVEALGLLHQRGRADDLHLTLVGGGSPDYEAHLKQRVAELQLDDHVTFLGRVQRAQIPGLLRISDVLLFTSVWEEPIARSVMEAMAAGLPVIGTAVGGQSEMLEDGDNALVFQPENAAELAACIEKLRQDSDLCIRLADAGRRMVLDRFTLARMVDEYEAWLEGIAG